MTQTVIILRADRNSTSTRLPWGVFLGGMAVERCHTLAAAKDFARRRFGVDRWHRESAGYYVERWSE